MRPPPPSPLKLQSQGALLMFVLLLYDMCFGVAFVLNRIYRYRVWIWHCRTRVKLWPIRVLLPSL